MIKGKPFVKWAGGKRQIIDKLLTYLPSDFNTYYGQSDKKDINQIKNLKEIFNYLN